MNSATSVTSKAATFIYKLGYSKTHEICKYSYKTWTIKLSYPILTVFNHRVVGVTFFIRAASSVGGVRASLLVVAGKGL